MHKPFKLSLLAFAALTLCCVFVCVSALAQHDRNGTPTGENMPDGGGMFERLLDYADTDGDGLVSFEEAKALIPFLTQEMFDKMDRNNDGALSGADLDHLDRLPDDEDGRVRLLRHLLGHADADGDGSVTLREAQAAVDWIIEEVFNALDRNDDGVLNRQDFPDFAPDPEPTDLRTRILNLIKHADADGDHALTYEEITAVHPDFSEEAFNRLDRNGDGYISLQDLPNNRPDGPRERLLRILRQADADNDGQITFEELLVVVPELTEEQFNRLDRNDDGVISRDDLHHFNSDHIEGLYNILREADADEDGEVTFEELQALIPELTQEQFDRLDRNGDGVISADDKPDEPVDPIRRLIHLLHEADADENGEVTFEELQAVAPDLTEERFNKLDRNGDGVISRADLPEPPEDPRHRLLRLLREADADQNGEVTFEELQAVLPDLSQERFDRLDRNGDGVISRADMQDSPVPEEDSDRANLLRLLTRADTNQDGVLDFAEIAEAFPDAPSELLERIDLNGDWVITRSELRHALAHALNSDRPIIPPHDVDADGATNATDVQATINSALGVASDMLPADIDDDGDVDAADVQQVINGALGLS